MGDEDDELRRRFHQLGAWYERQAGAAPAGRRGSAPARAPRRGLVALTALAAGVGITVSSVAVHEWATRPDNPETTLRPSPTTSSPADPTPTLRPSRSPEGTSPSPTSSRGATPRPSRSSTAAGPTAAAPGAVPPTASPSPTGAGGTGSTTVEVRPSPEPTAITVTNGAFEQQAPLLGRILGAAPPGWTGSSGVLGVALPRYPGSDVAGLSGPTAMTLFGVIAAPARQTIGEPVRAGATYRLTVAVGCRSTPEDFGGARLSLLVDGVRVASQEVTQAPACGRFTDVTVSWTAPADRAGQSLVIEIAKIEQRLVSYVDIDNVRLTAG